MLKAKVVPCRLLGRGRYDVFIMNRSCMRSLSRNTPLLAWHGRKPYMHFLHTFNCVAQGYAPTSLEVRGQEQANCAPRVSRVARHIASLIWRQSVCMSHAMSSLTNGQAGTDCVEQTCP